MFMFVLTLLILGSSVEQTSALAPTTALSFEHDLQSYMMLKLDMEPVEEAISICSWVKKKTAHGTTSVWINYNAPSLVDEFYINDRINDGAILLQDHLTNSVNVPVNEWHHVCYTWSFQTKTKILYFDGTEVASKATPADRKLAVDGTIAIGQFHKHPDLRAEFYEQPFGGELLKMNIYKRQLTAEEVGEMYASGMCSDYEDTLIADAFLRWETVLYTTERHGTITGVPITCPGDHWNVLYFDDFYNKVVNDELLGQMKDQFEVLEEFFGHKIDENLIQHLRTHH